MKPPSALAAQPVVRGPVHRERGAGAIQDLRRGGTHMRRSRGVARKGFIENSGLEAGRKQGYPFGGYNDMRDRLDGMGGWLRLGSLRDGVAGHCYVYELATTVGTLEMAVTRYDVYEKRDVHAWKLCAALVQSVSPRQHAHVRDRQSFSGAT